MMEVLFYTSVNVQTQSGITVFPRKSFYQSFLSIESVNIDVYVEMVLNAIQFLDIHARIALVRLGFVIVLVKFF
jgi:hypothetical protein